MGPGKVGMEAMGQEERGKPDAELDILPDYVGLDLSTPFPPYLLTVFLQVNNSVFTHPMASLFTRPIASACMPLPLLAVGLPCGSAGKESACNVETWVPSWGWEDPLEKGTGTHSVILAWRIPWTV